MIAMIGTGGGQGHVIEYRGEAIRALSMEARMTVCNMSIEAGARAGHDRTGRDDIRLPRGPAARAARAATGTRRCRDWRELRTDDDAAFDAEVVLDADAIDAVRHLGHQPGAGCCRCRARCPTPRVRRRRRSQRRGAGAGLHGADAGHAAARHRRRHGVRRLVHQRPHRGPAGRGRGASRSPGGRRRADAGGSRLGASSRAGRGRGPATRCFLPPARSGAQRGCSMCLGMNPDQLAPGERSASTSNRNFEGRQGKGGRTHLVSPLVAAATAVTGHSRLRPTCRRSRRPDADGAFTTTPAPALPLRRSNVDTDQIIPAVYLKRVTRTGFEDGLFAAWRTDPDFVLNRPEYAGASILRRRRRTSVRARHASTRSGRCRTTGSGSSSPRGSPTSSAATPASPDC